MTDQSNGDRPDPTEPGEAGPTPPSVDWFNFAWGAIGVVGLLVLIVVCGVQLATNVDSDEQAYLDVFRQSDDSDVLAWSEHQSDGDLLRLGRDVCNRVSRGDFMPDSRLENLVEDPALAILLVRSAGSSERDDDLLFDVDTCCCLN